MIRLIHSTSKAGRSEGDLLLAPSAVIFARISSLIDWVGPRRRSALQRIIIQQLLNQIHVSENHSAAAVSLEPELVQSLALLEVVVQELDVGVILVANHLAACKAAHGNDHDSHHTTRWNTLFFAKVFFVSKTWFLCKTVVTEGKSLCVTMMKVVVLAVFLSVAMAFMPSRMGRMGLKSSLGSEVESDNSAPLVDRVRASGLRLVFGC